MMPLAPPRPVLSPLQAAFMPPQQQMALAGLGMDQTAQALQFAQLAGEMENQRLRREQMMQPEYTMVDLVDPQTGVTNKYFMNKANPNDRMLVGPSELPKQEFVDWGYGQKMDARTGEIVSVPTAPRSEPAYTTISDLQDPDGVTRRYLVDTRTGQKIAPIGVAPVSSSQGQQENTRDVQRAVATGVLIDNKSFVDAAYEEISKRMPDFDILDFNDPLTGTLSLEKVMINLPKTGPHSRKRFNEIVGDVQKQSNTKNRRTGDVIAEYQPPPFEVQLPQRTGTPNDRYAIGPSPAAAPPSAPSPEPTPTPTPTQQQDVQPMSLDEYTREAKRRNPNAKPEFIQQKYQEYLSLIRGR